MPFSPRFGHSNGIVPSTDMSHNSIKSLEPKLDAKKINISLTVTDSSASSFSFHSSLLICRHASIADLCLLSYLFMPQRIKLQLIRMQLDIALMNKWTVAQRRSGGATVAFRTTYPTKSPPYPFPCSMSISVSMSVQLIARQHVLITLLNGVDATSGRQSGSCSGKWQVAWTGYQMEMLMK